MSTLATLNSRLDRELADSESINKTDGQRDEALNDACRIVYAYRKWPEVFENSTTLGVDDIINIPRNYDRVAALWFGKNVDFGIDRVNFINQTDFYVDLPMSATVTENNDLQMIRLSNDIGNKGFDANNTTTNAFTGVNDAAGRSQVGQTFASTTTTAEGVALRLRTQGSPTGTLTVSIFATAAGLPTGAALGSGTLNVNEVTSTQEWHWVKFTTAATLVSGTTYAITVNPSYATDAVNFVQWSSHGTSQVTGNQILNDGVTWSAGTGDMGFVVASDYYQFQYVKKFVTMSASTDDNGLSEDFDHAVCKIAAGLLLENKGFPNEASIKFYGLGGDQNRPNLMGGYGLLDQIWANKRINSNRQQRRIKSVYEKSATLDREAWPFSTLTNLY